MIILHLFHSSLIDYLFIRITKYFRFRICLIIHDVESLIHNQNKSWIRMCAGKVNWIVVHNQVIRDELLGKVNPADVNKIVIIPHGNFIGVVEKMDRIFALNCFNLDQHKKYLLFFGMIKKSKGLEILISAMKDVAPEIHLIVAGRCRDILFERYNSIIRQLNLSDRIHTIIRYISNAERNQLFNLAYAVVLPYQRVYQSGVILMAMSYELPVIASDLQANRLNLEGGNGLLFNVNDSSDLAEKINSLFSDDKKRKSFAESGKKYVSLNHNWEKIAEEYIKIFT